MTVSPLKVHEHGLLTKRDVKIFLHVGQIRSFACFYTQEQKGGHYLGSSSHLALTSFKINSGLAIKNIILLREKRVIPREFYWLGTVANHSSGSRSSSWVRNHVIGG